MALPPARSDGRPLYFDKPGGGHCAVCVRAGDPTNHAPGTTYIADPANSPFQDQAAWTICHWHLPDDAVIYNPLTRELRNKTGSKTWFEDDRSELAVGDRVIVGGVGQDDRPATIVGIDGAKFTVAFNDGTREEVHGWVRAFRRGDKS